MEGNQELVESVERLAGRIKLLPLVESCETVWPTRLDIELILPSYEEDLLKLSTLLKENASALVDEITEEGFELQVLLITSCYESSAFILSEELANVQQTIRSNYIWSKLMRSPGSLTIVTNLFKRYRRILLGDDWFYYFGDLSSFWGFVWDLLEYDVDRKLINKEVVNLIEQVCFNLMRSKSIQLCIKGITVIEECIHKTRGTSLMDYGTVYEELFKQTWRLFENDERNQQASVILLAGLFECVRVIEVDRNQLMTLIQNFSRWSKTDAMIELLLKSLESSKTVDKSIALMEHIILLLTMDHPNIQVISNHYSVLSPSQDANNNDTPSMNEPIHTLVIMDGSNPIDLADVRFGNQLLKYRHDRFHRWTIPLLQTLVKEVYKFKKYRTVYFQYLASVLFFIIDCPGLDFNQNSQESFTNVLQLMCRLLKKQTKYLDLVFSRDEDINNTLVSCVQFAAAAVNAVNVFAFTVIENCPNLSEALRVENESEVDFPLKGFLNDTSLKMERCLMIFRRMYHTRFDRLDLYTTISLKHELLHHWRDWSDECHPKIQYGLPALYNYANPTFYLN